MVRKVKRTAEYEIEFRINQDDYINTPQERQRNALLNQALKETEENLLALRALADQVLSTNTNIEIDDKTLINLEDDQIMEDWQIPLMQAMVDQSIKNGDAVLEIGFGRGISADMIQEKKVSSHTIIECNPHVIERFEQWKKAKPGKTILMVEGKWQDVIDGLPKYDAIFFHTYPLNQEEYLTYVHGKSTFAEHFFEHASNHLKTNGRFAYMTNEIDSLSRKHQRELLKYFSSFHLSIIELSIPKVAKDTWWINKMANVTAIK